MHIIKTKRIFAFAGVLGIGLITATPVRAQGTTFSQVQRGRYLSQIGDCMSCHTAKGDKQYAGGLPVATPFGTIYSTNITPDPENGIGKWSSDDFFRAMHYGIRRDGKHLYPAMPYPWFTKMSRSDVDALKAYLDTVKPVKKENKPTELPWPLSWRSIMAGWNVLFFHPGTYIPDSSQTIMWNRGAYLVEGGAHCAACHAAKNVFGASANSQEMHGGDAGESWFAPNLGTDSHDGIGGWTTSEIVEYLKTGSNSETAAAGPMTDVITNSTSHLTDHDLNAIAVYLKTIPKSKSKSSTEQIAIDQQAMDRGKNLYTDNCIGCHMAKGTGIENVFPRLADSAAIQSKNADSSIQVVLAGGKMAAPASKPTGLAMPSFGWKLDDQQVADLVNYIRNAWGNHAPAVDKGDVADVRADIKRYGARLPQPMAGVN